MIRHNFPDLQWLKKQIATEQFTKKGWPNVIIHAQGISDYRPDIKGPLSIFMNVQGESHCGVGKELVRVNTDYFFLSNQHQPYTLEIENTYTETFNIHLSEKLVSDVFTGLVHSSEKLTDNPTSDIQTPVEFYNRLYPKDALFRSLVEKLYVHSKLGRQHILQQEELLTELLMYLLHLHRHIEKQANKLAVVKKSTQVEIYKRLCLSLNYLHSCYTQEISLDELAAIACLSKFHFLRMFRTVFRLSPYQYLLNLRLEKARELLTQSSIPITQISIVLGFQNSTSFSRLFHQRYRSSPMQFRMEYGASKLAILVN
jgi:AraC family transcriptional regulator